MPPRQEVSFMVKILRVLVRLKSPTRVANYNTSSIKNLGVLNLTGLFNTGVIYSKKRIPGRDLGGAQTFEITITSSDDHRRPARGRRLYQSI
jgi:hypothetical protein